MHGHDGCGCGHAHGAPTGTQTEERTVELAESLEGGCGEGCGCGHGAGAEGLDAAEVAALRGFLSGIYASRLDAAQLANYLDQMADDASEFGRPAQFLAARLQEVAEAGAFGDEAPAYTLLEAVAGEDGDGSEEE